MLNIFYGDMKEAVYNTAGYFKYDYEDEWIVDPFVKKDTAGWIIGWGKDFDSC